MGAGDGILGAAALFAATLIWLSLPEESYAQTTVTTTTLNATNVTKVCHTKCCDGDALKTEARLACQEFKNWGIQDSTCVLWQMNAASFCTDSCSNCTAISKAMYDQCLFFLQSQMDFTQAMEYCKNVERDFEVAGRCTSACNVTVDECYSEEGKHCMRTCGNYQYCGCFKWRGVNGEPDSCSGNTVLEGFVEDKETGMSIQPLVRHGCYRIGDECKNHREGTECGKYKWCETDMCLVKDVSCPITDSCQKYGACLKATGDCYYTLRDDGVNCSDGLFYTHDDTCAAGTCVGWVDRCLRDDVKCGTTNPCLEPEGVCHAVTGACQFTKQPDGVPCGSQINKSIDGECEDGLCRRHNLDLCLGVNCSYMNAYCLMEPHCDPMTGKCVVEAFPEGMVCTDGDKTTFRDMCIEGSCVGHRFRDPKFEKIADGFCADEQGNMMQRYFADTFDEAECADQCAKDPSCVAYSFGFHFCSIYGGARSRHPSPGWWGQLWKLGSIWGDISVSFNNTDAGNDTFQEASGVTPAQQGQQKVACMKKVGELVVVKEVTDLGREIAFGTLLAILACTPGIWFMFYKLRQPHEDHEDEESDDGDGEAREDVQRQVQFKFSVFDDDAAPAPMLSDMPLASPRDGNSSAVAMVPPEDSDAVAVPAGSGPIDAADMNSQFSDPRGEVK